VRVRLLVLLSVAAVGFSSGGLVIAGGLTLSAYLKYWGLVLQVGGFVSVAVGLVERERIAGVAGLAAWVGRRFRLARNTVRRWIRRPVPPSEVTLTPAEFGIGGEAAAVSIALGSLGRSMSVDERLAELATRIEQTQEQVNRLQGELSAERMARQAASTEEREARQQALGQLDRKLNDLAGGGLRVEWWGVTAFVLGTILSTIPEELARGLVRIAPGV